MPTKAELEWMLAGFDPDSHRRGPDTDGSPCCPAHTLVDRIERLEGALKWIVNDAVYKAPEEHNWLSRRYVARARGALGLEKEELARHE